MIKITIKSSFNMIIFTYLLSTNKKREHRSQFSKVNQIFNFSDFSVKRPFHLVDDGVDHCGV